MFFACSTPPGRSGLSVIRISGEDLAGALDPVIKVIRSSGDYTKYSEMPGYVCAYSGFTDPETGEIIDRVIVTRFLPPHSYTGEEMAEISCHGGTAVRREIMRVLGERGIRDAFPGEFTKTAYINGKLDLTSAEAVMNVINAESRRALDAANSQLMGKLREELGGIESELYSVLSLIEMIVEFPEHDDTPANTDEVMRRTDAAAKRTEDLVDSYRRGRLLTERIRVALAGRPNSGKSTLFNLLAGYDRAIVTDIPGTTRDVLETDADIDGLPVTFIDTAGLRDTDDAIEAAGVDRAREQIRTADLCYILIPPDEEKNEAIERIREITSVREGKKTGLLFTKSDVAVSSDRGEISDAVSDVISGDVITISSVSGENTDMLSQSVKDFYEEISGSVGTDITILSRRHSELLRAASQKLRSASDAVRDGFGEDVASSVIRSALEEIGRITGKSVSSELADSIFANFCIGK